MSFAVASNVDEDEKKEEQPQNNFSDLLKGIDLDSLGDTFSDSDEQEPTTPVKASDTKEKKVEKEEVVEEETETGGAFNAVKEWTANTTSEAGRIIFQEIGADYLGVLSHEGGFGKGDMYWNQFVDPNNWRHNPEYKGMDGLSVEKDQRWLRLKNGDVYSLTTGLKYPSHLLPENVDNILKDESLLSQIGNAAIGRNWTTERKNKEELTQLMNTKGSGATLVQHPALTRVEAIKKALTEHNKKNPNNTLGPTGDYGATQNRQLAGVAKFLGNTVDEEGGITWEQDELEHGEGIVGSFLGYGIPIALLAWANNRAFGSALKPFSTKLGAAAHGPNAARIFAGNAPAAARFKTAGARILKGSTDFALESALVSRAAESEVSTFPTNELFGLDPSDEINFEEKHGRKMTNEDRRILNMKRDMFIYGPIFGNLGEFGGPLTKSFRGSIRNIPANLQKLPGRVNQKVDELSEKTADVIADIVFENKLRANEQKAIELAKEGPSPEVKNDQVIPTERVTGSKKTEPEEIIKPKGTQRELDLQVKEATEAKIKAEKQTDKTAKVLLDSAQAVKPEELEGPRTLAEELEGINPDKLTKKELLQWIRRLGNEATDNELKALGITREQIDNIPRGPEVDDSILKVEDVEDTVEFKAKEAGLTEKQARGRKKIQPGDPHPTDKNKVRGYNGRWVTKTYFDKVTKSRAGAEKIKESVFAKDKKKIEDLGKSIKEAEAKANAQKTIEEIEADVQKKVDSMTDEEIKESLRKDPKYKDLIDEMDALEKSADERLEAMERTTENIDRLIRESDEIMDSLDEQIFQLSPTDEARISLEKAYEGVDAVRQDLRAEKKAQIEGVPDEIGGKSEPIESPLTERPTFGFEIRGGKPKYIQMFIEFESDVDRAIYIVTTRVKRAGVPAKDRPLYVEQANHDPSKANHKYLAFLYDLGFDDALILKHAPKIYDTLAKNYSANNVYRLKDTNAWKAGSDFDLEIDEKEFYNPERGLDEEVKKQGEEILRRYKELTDPKDPNTAENLLRDEDMQLEAGPQLPPIEPNKGNKGKSYEDLLSIRAKEKGITNLEDAISAERWVEISEKIQTILKGDDVKFDLRFEFKTRRTAASASAYGQGKAGQIIQPRGGYSDARDLIVMSMVFDGKYVEFSRALKTAYHESFHRLQRKFLTEAEIKVLNNAAPKLRKLVKEAYPELSDKFIKGLDNIELQAFAFGAWSDPKIVAKYKTTWAKPFEKIAEILRAVINVFSKEYRTWDDLFKAAEKGQIAERGKVNGGLGVRSSEGFMLEMDPDDFTDGMKKRGEELANGERNIEDVMGETIEGGNDPAEMARRLRSRSGKTEYIPRDQEELIMANETFNEILQTAVGDRAAATGIRSINLAQIKELGKKKVIELGLDPKETIVYFERARKGDLRSQDDLVGLAGLIWHRDINLQTLTENSISYEGALGAEQVKAGQRLLASMEDQLKLDIALQTISRKWGQSGKVLQQGFADFTAQALPEGTILRQTVSKEASEGALKTGFKAEDGPAGKGVYFSTEQTPGPAGSVEIYGELNEDLLVLDLVSSNRQLEDLAKQVNPKFNGKITAKDKKAIEALVREKGYIGIRYPDGLTGDKVLIYPENAANRIVDSDASIPPERLDNQPVKSLIQTALDGVENILTKKLDPRVAESLERGQMTNEAKQVLDGLSAVSYALNDGKKAGINLLNLVDKVPDGKLTRDTVWNLYRNLIFLRVSTFMKVFGGSQYRTLTMPINIALGELTQRKGMSPIQLEQSKRRVEMAWRMYPRLVKQLPYAFEMWWAAMRHNEVLVNIGRGQFEGGTTNRYIGGSKQLELDFEGQAITKELTGNEWWLDGNNNPLSIAANYIGEFHKTGASRIMAGFDSFHAAMVGPTTEYFRFYDLEIEKLHSKGIEGPRAHNEAHETAMKRVEKAMQDIDLADGKVIKNGRLTGSHAKKAMDWINFTDDIEIGKGSNSPIENRTYEYGVQKAREEGLTDSREILERATEWANEVPGVDYGQLGEINMPWGLDPLQAERGLMNTTNLPGKLWQMVMNKAPLIAYPAQAVNRTPVNIGKSAQRAIPGMNKYVDSYWRDIHSEDWITRSKALGEGATAQVILGLGISMVATGLVKFNGFRPWSQEERQEWLETGIDPLTVQVFNPFTGKYTGGIPLDMLDGPANIWGAIGTYTSNYQLLRQRDQETFFALTAIAAIRPTAQQMIIGQTDRGGFQGFRRIMTLISEIGSGQLTREIKGDQSAFERYVLGVLTGSGALGGPGYVRDMRNAIDPIQRDIDTSRIDVPFLPQEADNILRAFENSINTWKNGIPYLSEQNPPVLHTFTGQPVQVRRVPFDDGIPADMPLLKLANSQSPLAAFKGRLPSTNIVDEERLRLQGPGSNATFIVWNRRMFNLPDKVLNRSEINQVQTIGTTVKLVYPPVGGRHSSGAKDQFGRGKLRAIESENGLTLNEALAKLVTPAKKDEEPTDYQKASDEPSGNNRSEKSDMWWEIINVYKEVAKEKFMYQSDTGPDSIGWEIKQKLMESRNKANAQRTSYDRYNPTASEFVTNF